MHICIFLNKSYILLPYFKTWLAKRKYKKHKECKVIPYIEDVFCDFPKTKREGNI